MGPDCYLYSCNRSSTTSLRSCTGGPDCYLLLQQDQHHLPEELDTGGTSLVPTPATGAAPPS